MTQADRDLIELALDVLRPGECSSMIVGTAESGDRGLHGCEITFSERIHGHKTHHCACGQSWRYIKGDERWSDVGPLTDVVHSS